MRIAFVSQGSLRAFKERELEGSVDVTVFGFNGAGEVSYEKELKGESTFFEEGAKLSKRDKNVVLFGCVTDTMGHKRKSVAVADNGRLLGVSDMLHAIDGECSSGANVKTYETKAGKLGVVVDKDLYFPQTLKTLALCGSSVIVCAFDSEITDLERSYVCVYAHVYGIPVLLCGKGFCIIASSKGELIFSSPFSPAYAAYEERVEYHLVETRTARRFS